MHQSNLHGGLTATMAERERLTVGLQQSSGRQAKEGTGGRRRRRRRQRWERKPYVRLPNKEWGAGEYERGESGPSIGSHFGRYMGLGSGRATNISEPGPTSKWALQLSPNPVQICVTWPKHLHMLSNLLLIERTKIACDSYQATIFCASLKQCLDKLSIYSYLKINQVQFKQVKPRSCCYIYLYGFI